MNKKGFTLVELLAVVALLGIISVIIIPVSINTLKDAKKRAFKQQIVEISKAAKMYYQEELADSENDHAYLDLSKESDRNKLQVKSIIKAGIVDITSNGKVDVTALNDEFCGRKEYNSKQVNLLSLDNLYCLLADSNNTTGTSNAGEILSRFNELQSQITELQQEVTDLKTQNSEMSSNFNAQITLVSNAKTQFLNTHPIGSIYTTVASDENSASAMATKYGGTWTAYGQGRVLVGVGSNGTTNYSTVDSTGGAESSSYTPAGTNSGGTVQSHTLTAAESGLPSHSHRELLGYGGNDPAQGLNYGNTFNGWHSGWTENTGGWNASQGHTHGFTNPTFTGTAASISRIQPYKTVYMYKRTA